jgi:hypothetical protein
VFLPLRGSNKSAFSLLVHFCSRLRLRNKRWNTSDQTPQNRTCCRGQCTWWNVGGVRFLQQRWNFHIGGKWCWWWFYLRLDSVGCIVSSSISNPSKQASKKCCEGKRIIAFIQPIVKSSCRRISRSTNPCSTIPIVKSRYSAQWS